MSNSVTTGIAAIAEAVADGEIRLAVDNLRACLDALPGLRQFPEVTRLHREVIQHRAAIVRLEKDAGAGHLPPEAERSERARLTAALLDISEELEVIAQKRALLIPIDTKALAAARAIVPAIGGDAQRNDQAIAGDVFLSYAHPDRTDIVELAMRLRGRSCSVWFDHYIVAGARFREEIARRLDGARAVVVLWSAHSIKSDWVLYEADRAHKLGKLIPVRRKSIPVEAIPAPYPAVLNIIIEGDDESLARALISLGALRT